MMNIMYNERRRCESAETEIIITVQYSTVPVRFFNFPVTLSPHSFGLRPGVGDLDRWHHQMADSALARRARRSVTSERRFHGADGVQESSGGAGARLRTALLAVGMPASWVGGRPARIIANPETFRRQCCARPSTDRPETPRDVAERLATLAAEHAQCHEPWRCSARLVEAVVLPK